MERDNDVIELGAVCEETKGPGGIIYADEVLMRNNAGLSDD